MFYLSSRAIGPLLVLVFGLVSCAPDKEKKEVFLASPPEIIVRGGSQMDLKMWDQRNEKSLDLQDSLRVRGGNSAEISTRCRKGDLNFNFATITTSPNELTFLQLLPTEILGTDFKVSPVHCSFDIVVKNGSGSRHIFNLKLAQIKDESDATAEVFRDGNRVELSRERLNLNKLAGLKLRAKENLKGEAAVYCEDVRIPAVPFNLVVDLADANFANAEVLPARDANALEARPLQLCRAAIRSSGLVKAITAPFYFQFPRSALSIEEAFRKAAFREDYYDRLVRQGHSVVLRRDRLQNPSSVRRWVRIRKGPRSTDITVAYRNSNPPQTVNRPYIEMEFPTAGAKDLGDSWVVPVEAKSNIELITRLRLRPYNNCFRAFDSGWPAFIVHMPAVENLTELNHLDIPLGEVQMDFGAPIIIIKPPTELNRNTPIRVGSVCNW